MNINNETITYESVEDAINLAIRKANKTNKEVALVLWPNDEPYIAIPRLADALNPRKKQKLTLKEIILICNYCNRYDPLYYMCDECLHNRPTVKAVEVESAEVQRALTELCAATMKGYQDLLKCLERRNNIETLRMSKNIVDLKITR